MLKGKGTLTPIQENLLYEIGKIREASFFFLTGGTALAEFYLGHRRSYDLDFFTAEENLLIPFVRRVEEGLPKAQYKVHVIRLLEAFAEVEVHKEGEAVRLHFACDSPFRFEEPQPSEFGVKINDYRDLIVDKLLTFFGRWKHRDAIDLFFILQNEPIEALMEKAKEKDPGFDLYWFCMALREIEAYPDEIAQWPVDMLVEVNVSELKNKFADLAREIMDRIKKDQSA
jgi:predicted nucleotidyltransferase component of viral defense system